MMRKRISAGFVLVALVAGFVLPAGLARAQEAEQAPERLDANAQSDLFLKATHGDWRIVCEITEDADTGEEGEACVMVQTILNQDGAPVIEFKLQKETDAKTADDEPVGGYVQIVTPLNMYLPAGLGIKVDDGDVIAAPFIRCTEIGCFVLTSLTTPAIASMKRGRKATIIVITRPGQALQGDISLTGFTAAYNSL